MTQRQTIKKWFWVWDFEKEEQWLNTMALSGWVLDDVSFCAYHFVACEPGEYSVRLEMRGTDDDYISFMEETGAEYIGRMVQWIYFRKKAEHGPFDLFSDLDSRISHLDRIGKMLLAITLLNLGIGLSNMFNPVAPLGWINLLCATLLTYCLGRIHGKKEALEKNRLLQE